MVKEKHSVWIDGKATSVCVERGNWSALKAIALAQGKTVKALVAEIDADSERDEYSLGEEIDMLVFAHEMANAKSPVNATG